MLLCFEVVLVGLIYVVGDNLVGLVVLRRKAKDLNVLIIGNQDSSLIELKSLSVSLNAPLAESYMIMAYFCTCLK